MFLKIFKIVMKIFDETFFNSDAFQFLLLFKNKRKNSSSEMIENRIEVNGQTNTKENT